MVKIIFVSKKNLLKINEKLTEFNEFNENFYSFIQQ